MAGIPTDIVGDDECGPAKKDIFPFRLVVVQEEQGPLVSNDVSDICPTNVCSGNGGETDDMSRERLHMSAYILLKRRINSRLES